MILKPRVVRDSAGRAAQAANRVLHGMQDGLITQEPAVTDRMLGGIQEAMHDYRPRGLRWQAKTLGDRGVGSEESQYGADFAVALEVDVTGQTVKKGFLAQAKFDRDGKAMSTSEFHDLTDQCEKMLGLSSDAFVFIYSRTEIRVLPAIAVYGVSRTSVNDVYSRSIGQFLEDFFECFVGDGRIKLQSMQQLDLLKEEWRVRRLLALRLAK